MEKFAVDLDKVLDDFELDEVENVGASQFGQLQLDYSSSASTDSSTINNSIKSVPTARPINAPSTANAADVAVAGLPVMESGLASMGGWSKPSFVKKIDNKLPYKSGHLDQQCDYGKPEMKLDLETSDAAEDIVIPGVRSPPDGQNDDQSQAVAHHSQHGGGSLLTCSDYQSYPSKVISHSLPFSHGPVLQNQPIINYGSSSTNVQSRGNEMLWPRFAANNLNIISDNLSLGSPQLSNNENSTNPSENLTNSGSISQEGSIRREAIGASPTEDTKNVLVKDDQSNDSDISTIPPDISQNLSQSYGDTRGALLDLGDEFGSSVTVSRPVSGSVLDLVSSRPVDVISFISDDHSAVVQRPLDVVTSVCASATMERYESVSCSRHPDVIDVSLLSTADPVEGVSVRAPQPSSRDFDAQQNHLQNNENELVPLVVSGNENVGDDARIVAEIVSVGSHPKVHGQRLLPDLMANNNPDMACLGHSTTNEYSEPAIVMENTSTMNSNDEPALVQESKTFNRIPEVVNVHQSCEAGTATSANCDTLVQSTAVHVEELPVVSHRTNNDIECFPGNRNVGEIQLERGTCASDLVKESISAHTFTESASPAEHALGAALSPGPIVFNPEAEIGDDADLEAELAELEKEQQNLDEAYNLNAEIKFKSSNTLKAAGEQTFEYSVDPSEMNASVSGLDVTTGARALPNRASELERVEMADEKEGSVDNNIEEGAGFFLGTRETVVFKPESRVLEMSSAVQMSTPELTTQMSEEFSTDQNCGLVGSLPRIAAEVFETSAAGVCSSVNPNLDNDCVAADDETCSAVDCDNGLNISDNPNRTDDGDVYDAARDNTLGEGVTVPEEPRTSPTRLTPGSLVTAVYEDSHSRSRGDTSGASSGNPSNLAAVGGRAPFWVPDDDAANCQECVAKFTLVRRRHHCRACGRVLCAQCCKDKAPLAYMQFREARVCQSCRLIIKAAEDKEESRSRDSDYPEGGASLPSSGRHPRSPDPNNPMEYCSRIPPPQQAGGGAVGSPNPPTVMVPVGVLKREDSGSSGRPRSHGPGKQVIFSDGIRPGGDLTELDHPSSTGEGSSSSSQQHHPPPPHRARAGRVAKIMPGTGASKAGVRGDVCLLPPGGGLPPVLLDRRRGLPPEYLPSDGDCAEGQQRLAEQMAGDGPPVLFALHKNLTVVVKKVKLECCVGVEVWSMATRGLCGVGQEELVLLLEVRDGETHPPADVFAYFYSVYQQANKGNLVSELGHTILTDPEGFLGSRDHGGFLYVRPTFQCLHNLPLPQPPFLFALLIHKWEAPWAKVFPLRLLLRLGAEFRYYPCPLVSTRNRKPVFSEIGHTIMNLLVDFRNYTYTIPGIQGLVVHMEDKKTTLYIPRNRYAQVSQALGNSNDHVLAVAANFSPQADSHLVTIENDDGQYSTQAINIHNRPRKVTGASFVVFNGALKSNCGLTAKSSIVEDGLMVQITGDVMSALRDALRSMKDFSIACGVTGQPPQEEVLLRWAEDDNNFNVGVTSPVDGKALDGVPSVKIHSGTDYVSSDFLIRWTEVFIIQGESSSNSAGDVNLSRIWEGLARGFCVALTPHLAQLHAEMSTHLALRATIHHQQVGYEAGSGNERLSTACLNSLDSELVAVIHRAAATVTHDPIVLELFFHVLQQ